MKLINKKFKAMLSLVLVLIIALPLTNVTSAKAEILEYAENKTENSNKDNSYVGKGYQVNFSVDNQWDGSFNGSITITNTSEQPIENWYLVFNSKIEINNIWNAEIVNHEGDTYKIKNVGWNQDISVGQSVSFGFSANFTEDIDIPQSYEILGRVVEVPSDCCEFTYKIRDQWDTAYIIDVTLTNHSKKAIEDWSVQFDFKNEITNIWNGTIESNSNGTYVIKNCGYNGNIAIDDSVSFGFQANILDKDNLLPENGRMAQIVGEIDYNWSQKMIHADSEAVVEARKQVNDVVKVALIDSGVDYSPEINVVARKNFVPGYDEEELNPLFDDLSGHGTAIAALIGSNPEYSLNDFNKEYGYWINDIPDENEEDYSYLTDTDKVILKPELDTDLDLYLKKQGETLIPYKYVEEQGDDCIAQQLLKLDNAMNEEKDNYLEEDKDERLYVRGINPNAEIYSARVLDEFNKAPVSRVIEALNWAIDERVNIINLSWGMDEDNKELHSVIQRAYKNGILIIAAAGNGENVQYPAKYKEVMAIGSIDYESKKSLQSASGDEIEVVAPGDNIYSRGLFGIIENFSGTSIAAPQVTGLASILWQMDLTKSNEFIRYLIDVTANKIGNKQYYGYGLIDCEYAISQYDKFSKEFNENISNLDHNIDNILSENEKTIVTFSKDNIYGSWGHDGHEGVIIDQGLNAHELSILRSAINWPDQKNSGFKGMTNNPGFHGYCNEDNKCDYVAAYIYLTEQALSYQNQGTFFTAYDGKDDKITAMDINFIKQFNNADTRVEELKKEQINQQQADNKKQDITEKNIQITDDPVDAWDQLARSLNINEMEITNKDKAIFIYGLALHTVGDVFSHSTYAYTKIMPMTTKQTKKITCCNFAWDRLHHGPLDKNGKLTYTCDKRLNHPLRYYCAIILCKNMLKKFNDEKYIYQGVGEDFLKCDSYPNVYKQTNIKEKCDYLVSGFAISMFYDYVKKHLGENDEGFKQKEKDIKGLTLKYIEEKTTKWKFIDITMKKNSNNYILKVQSKKGKFEVEGISDPTKVSIYKDGILQGMETNDKLHYIFEAKKGISYTIQFKKKKKSNVKQAMKLSYY